MSERRRWFLPETPDVIGALRRQLAVTAEGVAAFADWSRGAPGAGDRVEDAEHRGNAAARALLLELRAAFVTPLEPEDLFALSRGIDRVLDYARDAIREAIVMETTPDEGIATMATAMADAVGRLDLALAALARDEAGADDASAAADAAVAAVRRLDDAYDSGMAALLQEEDRTARIGRRELYRRCERIGEAIAEVAERVVYAVVKQS